MKKRNDIILIVALASLALLAAALIWIFARAGETVVVKQDNKIVYSGRLSADKTVTLPHNTVVIKNGVVKMRHADCKNQICVQTGEIKNSGESIVCLPNRVIAEIK